MQTVRSVLGPVATVQLARDVAPHLVEWRTSVKIGYVFDAERAAIMRQYVDTGDGNAMHEALTEWASLRRAQGRGAARGGVLG